MGSFKANGREQGPNRRRSTKSAKRRNFPRLEWLEDRQLLSGGNPCGSRPRPNLADVQNGPMANLGGELINVYETFHYGVPMPEAAGEVPPRCSSRGVGARRRLTRRGRFHRLHDVAPEPGHADRGLQPTVRAGRRLHADQRVAGRRRDAGDHERPARRTSRSSFQARQ